MKGFWRSYGALLLGVVGLGFSAPLVRWAEAPAAVSMFYRMALGGLLLTPWGLAAVRRTANRRALAWAVLGGLCFAADVGLWATGILLSGATMPTLLGNTAPLWVGLGSWLFFRRRPTGGFWLGVALALSGATLVLGIDLQRATVVGLGTALGLLGAVFYGAYQLVTERGRREVEAVAYLWVSTWASALALGLLAVAQGAPLWGYPPRTWAAFAAMGLLVQGAAWWLINEAQGHLPAAVVSPTLLLQPVFTAVVAGIWLGERFTPLHLLGGALVLSGVYTVHHAHRAQRRRAVPLPTPQR